MIFSSDAALAQIPEELRAEMPGLGFRRGYDGRFFLFPHPMLFRGAYEVPDEELATLAQAVQEQRGRLYAGISIAIPIAAFIAAFLLGASWVEDRPPPASSDRFVPAAVVGGSLALCVISAVLWARLSAARLARAQLVGMRFDRRIWLLDQLTKQPRMPLWAPPFLACLVGLFLWLGYVHIVEVWAAAWAGATGVAVYGILSLLLHLALSVGLVALLLAWSFARWRPAHWVRLPPRWAPISSWAHPSAATVARWQSESEVAHRSRSLWRKLVVPDYRCRLGGLLTFLHLALYVGLMVALVIAATEFWKDRRPADADLLAFFAEATLPPADDSKLAPVVLKWTLNPAVHLMGDAAEREDKSLQEALHSLSLVTGLNWHRAASADSADVLIEVIYADDDEDPQAEADQGSVNYTFDRSGALTGGRLVVRDRRLYRVILPWGLAEIAGLRGESSFGSSSVTSGASSFTALDRTALLLLYSAEIEPGSSAEDAAKKAREIVAAWPDTLTFGGLVEELAARDRH